MFWFGVIALLIFVFLVRIGIKKEWNRFLFVLVLLALVPSSALTIVILSLHGVENFGFIFCAVLTLVLSVALYIVLNQSRCPHCKKYFKAQKVNDELVEQGEIYHRNDKTYQKNLYRKDYVCLNCENEWSRNVRREEEV